MSGAIVVAGLAVTAHADAEETCVLRLTESAYSAGWRGAVNAAETVVAPADCAEIVVTPDRHGAAVTFITRDGRVAERRIGRPAELSSLVEALRVGVPLSPPPRATEAPTEEPPSPLPTPDVEADVEVAANEPPGEPGDRDRVPVSPHARGASIVLFAGGGVSANGDLDSFAPQAQFGVGITANGWEADVFGRVEAEHDTESRQRPTIELSSTGGGARFARRQTMGPLVLLAGAAVSGQGTTEERHRSTVSRHVEASFFEPRAGAFLGVASPRVGTLRGRAEILCERALASRDGTGSLPTVTSTWSVGVMFGVETVFVP